MNTLILKSLKLLCKEADELQLFGDKISFFHGEMSSGKSSIVELIDFCLGGRLARTPAIASEVLTVQLIIEIQGNEYLLERLVSSQAQVIVSWTNEEHAERVLLPIKAGENPVLDGGIFNLSDFLMDAIGLGIIKVPARKSDPDSKLHRLSFRDFFKLCYLDQPDLDSSFFVLEQPIRREKTKDVLKFVLGFQSDQLTTLQQQLSEVRQKQRSLREAATQIDTFLADYGFNSEEGIDAQVDEINAKVELLENERDAQTRIGGDIEFVSDEIRTKAEDLEERFHEKQAAISDIKVRIAEQEALSAELISLKIKAARSNTATEILERAGFNACPQCGTQVGKSEEKQKCSLCKEPLTGKDSSQKINVALVNQDLNDRIDDLKVSLKRLTQSLGRQLSSLQVISEERIAVQQRIDLARSDVESEYIQRARRIESELGQLNERRLQLMRVRAMPAEIERRRVRADKLTADISELQRKIDLEKEKFQNGRLNLVVLERNFHDILKAIHFPEISENDRVRVNTNTWLPEILPDGNEARAWGFADAGSGGKKVLFKTSFALALHKTAAEMELDLPKIFIVDSTMKNITPDINKDVFEHFYKEVYRLLMDELSEWQCIIVDQTFSPYPDNMRGTIQRFMTNSNPEHPPLISYYSGH